MLLVHDTPRGRIAGIIVETEAYTGSNDPGSHACRGLRKRNAPMFGPPGRAYVYKCHMYPLLNVVTGKAGTPGAVLLRAVEPAEGAALMNRNRPNVRDSHGLANGPGKLGLAFGIRLSHNTADLINGPLFLARRRQPPPYRIRRSTRIGLRGPARLLRWRFYAADNPCVSVHPDLGRNS